ncbi:unnamed protein product [Mytilus edulis]|uniref:Uncharacterized protein n=1 Tax=Mytilus edulis TaxID=6550 RepID=A0A8S3RJL7_MYTED|nr:unnamed protein product [Mytilus edulis]
MGCNPLSNETEIGDDVERIINYRNRMDQRIDCEMSDEEMAAFFTEFIAVGERIDAYLSTKSNITFKDRITWYQTCPMGGQNGNEKVSEPKNHSKPDRDEENRIEQIDDNNIQNQIHEEVLDTGQNWNEQVSETENQSKQDRNEENQIENSDEINIQNQSTEEVIDTGENGNEQVSETENQSKQDKNEENQIENSDEINIQNQSTEEVIDTGRDWIEDISNIENQSTKDSDEDNRMKQSGCSSGVVKKEIYAHNTHLQTKNGNAEIRGQHHMPLTESIRAKPYDTDKSKEVKNTKTTDLFGKHNLQNQDFNIIKMDQAQCPKTEISDTCVDNDRDILKGKKKTDDKITDIESKEISEKGNASKVKIDKQSKFEELLKKLGLKNFFLTESI